MRPEILYPLFKPVTTLKGVGPRIANAIKKAIGNKGGGNEGGGNEGGGNEGGEIVDLLWHLPVGVIDRSYQPTVMAAEPGRIATLSITVGKHEAPRNKRLPYRIKCFDDSGEITLVFFHAHSDYLKKTMPEGEPRVISGTIEHYQGAVQMTHPDHMVKPDEIEGILGLEPIYPLSAGVSQKVMGKIISGALCHATALPEWLDDAYVKKMNWPTWGDAIAKAHNPENEIDLQPDSPARKRLAYDELLANQLALGLVRSGMRRAKGRPIIGDGILRKKVLDTLSFELTASQTTAISEIDADMKSDIRMLRLLQGDVGSGKTVVALMAMLSAVEAGGQGALMAPTEVLARQHMRTIEPLASAAGIEIILLTGREKGKNREAILSALASGKTTIAIGTHALFQDDVVYHDLRIAVIDEQHRFGVHQRLSLTDKGNAVDVMVMTATPIPRTLMLTAYGDMDVSRLLEKPKGRKPIDTRVMPISKLDKLIEAMDRKIKTGARAFWVCPLVEESEKLDLSAAEDRFEYLRSRFGEKVGLVHGRMKAKEKDAAMQAFAEGSISILVATTVIEVGVDVSAATVMVVEHAERFGLAQLHQLRGRVGRGDNSSSCILLYQAPLGETANARLEIMRSTEDGFVIAEEDLRLRGSGELLGTKQSGLPRFRLGDVAQLGELIQIARDDTELILNKDPGLKSERSKALRVLLYLFQRDGAIKYLRSG